MAKDYDVVILGGGTGGYVAAIRASQLGLKTAIVERDKLGGTCLHYGCIPTKSYLRSAEVARLLRDSSNYGVKADHIAIDFKQVYTRKNEIVEQLYKGVQGLIKKGKIDVYNGVGRILGPSIFSPLPGTISVELNNGEENEMLIPKYVVISTGAKPRHIDGVEVDGTRMLDSNDMLNLTQLPTSITIVGGGVIGVEWASMLADFGVKVQIIELGEHIIPAEDADIRNALFKMLNDKGILITTNVQIDWTKTEQTSQHITLSGSVDGNLKAFTSEVVLLSIGRVANTSNIGIENTDIELTNGYIQVNDNYQTKESHIYAIGDVIGGMQLAHVASYEGVKAIEHIAGVLDKTPFSPPVPRCIYSSPEVASIGLTEQQVKEQKLPYKVSKFPFAAIGKALVKGEKEGFVKLIVHEQTNDLLGVHMIGPNVTDLISEAGLALVLNASPWEISQMIHPHPSLSEVFGEAALLAEGKAIHF